MSPMYIARHTTLTSHISANNESLLSTVVLETSAITPSEGLHHQFIRSINVRLNLKGAKPSNRNGGKRPPSNYSCSNVNISINF